MSNRRPSRLPHDSGGQRRRFRICAQPLSGESGRNFNSSRIVNDGVDGRFLRRFQLRNRPTSDTEMRNQRYLTGCQHIGCLSSRKPFRRVILQFDEKRRINRQPKRIQFVMQTHRTVEQSVVHGSRENRTPDDVVGKTVGKRPPNQIAIGRKMAKNINRNG